MSFDEKITLKWNVLENGKVVEKSIDIFANKGPVKRSEFYASYQTGKTVNATFYVNSDDYEMSKTIDQTTGKPKYASKLIHNGATYDIFHDGYSNDGIIEIVCR